MKAGDVVVLSLLSLTSKAQAECPFFGNWENSRHRGAETPVLRKAPRKPRPDALGRGAHCAPVVWANTVAYAERRCPGGLEGGCARRGADGAAAANPWRWVSKPPWQEPCVCVPRGA